MPGRVGLAGDLTTGEGPLRQALSHWGLLPGEGEMGKMAVFLI